MEDSSGDLEASRPLRYRLCPRCARAVPIRSTERYCINDGSWLLEACPLCGAGITNPYTRFCGCCGLEFGKVETETTRGQR